MVPQPAKLRRPLGGVAISGESVLAKSIADEAYSEEETAQRRDEVTRRMINMPPRPRSTPTQKTNERPASKGRVHKGKTRI
jgi:hypothetical protein